MIWWFATPCEYRTVAELFGIGEATLCNLIREVCRGIQQLMLRKYINLPYGPELQRTLSQFASRGMPFCVGAIDGTYIQSYHREKTPQTIIIAKAGIQ